MILKEIKFKGNTYLLSGGAITTKEDFENGIASYAHLYEDGKIRRYGREIGIKRDIEFTGKEVNVEPRLDVFGLLDNVLDGSSGWR